MGYEDINLLLADDETFSSAANGANSGDGGLGQQSVDLALEPGGTTEFFRNYDAMGNGASISLSLIVGDSVTGTGYGDTLEIQVVSLPVNASYLANGAGGAGDGKLLTTIALVASTGIATFISPAQVQDMALGTPVFLTAQTGLTGIALNTIYYVMPTNRWSFTLALSLADALAGTPIAYTGTGTLTLSFAPAMCIHASTGSLLLWNAGVPTNQSALRDGTRLQVPLRPFMGPTAAHEYAAQHGGAAAENIPFQPLGAGSGGPDAAGGPPDTGLVGAQPNQFYYLRYVPSDTITAGSIKKASLVLTGESQLVYPGSGYVVKG